MKRFVAGADRAQSTAVAGKPRLVNPVIAKASITRTALLNDTAHLSNIAEQTKAALQVEKLEVIADRGYFNGEEILACGQADITVTLPKPQRSGAKSEGRFGKQDFVYIADADVYRCPAGEKLTYRFTAEEHGQKLRQYWTDACRNCPIKAQCTTGKQRSHHAMGARRGCRGRTGKARQKSGRDAHAP